MDIYKKFTDNEIDLLKRAGVRVDTENFNDSNIVNVQNQIVEYIMSASTKNGDIDKLRNQYDDILTKL